MAPRVKKIETCLYKVTPKEAKKWLEDNDNNRKLSARIVSRYAAEMAAGTWEANGETLKFDQDWKLLDGQHRLAAIVESGKTQEMLLAINVSRDAFKTIDTGRRRSSGDVLGIAGFKNRALTAGIVNLLLRYADYVAGESAVVVGKKYRSSQSILEYAEKHATLLEKAVSASISTGRLLYHSAAGAAYVVIVNSQRGSTAAADSFFEGLSKGEDLHAGDPVLALRQRCLALKCPTNSHGAMTRPQEYQFALILKAFQAYSKGRSMTTVKFAPEREAFPIL